MNEDKLNLTVINEDGSETEHEYDVLLSFESKENGKCYIIYSDSVEDEDGNIEIMASWYDPADESMLYAVETDEEWAMIDEILDEIENSVPDLEEE